jgi:hypothetical protein
MPGSITKMGTPLKAGEIAKIFLNNPDALVIIDTGAWEEPVCSAFLDKNGRIIVRNQTCRDKKKSRW